MGVAAAAVTLLTFAPLGHAATMTCDEPAPDGYVFLLYRECEPDLVIVGVPRPEPAPAADYAWPVVRVIDGDTVAVDASADMPPELAAIKVRLRGVDTPEKGGRAKCEAERAGGQAATAFTEQAVAEAATIMVRDPKWGKWGGRVIADLMVDGRSLAALLIEAGHGRPYDGGRRQSRCH